MSGRRWWWRWAVVAAVASALGPRGGLALKFLEIISPLVGGGCCWGGWSVRGWRLVVGWWLLLARVVVVFFSAAGRHGVLRGGTGARWWVVVVVRRWALGFPLGG